jgi:hypothetical protein
MDIKETGYDGVGRINLFQWRVYVNTAMNINVT